MNYILRILLSAIAVIVIGEFLPGVYVDSYTTAIWVAFTLGILFSILKPILVVLTLPATILTLGLFMFAINAGLILLADNFIDGFNVSGFWVALIFSILLSVVESILFKVLD